MISKIILELIDYYKGLDNFEEDNEITKMEDYNNEFLEKNYKELYESDNEITEKNIDELYIDIIISIIQKNGLKDS